MIDATGTVVRVNQSQSIKRTVIDNSGWRSVGQSCKIINSIGSTEMMRIAKRGISHNERCDFEEYSSERK